MKISCLLLAAGQSSRMGGVNKLMLKVGASSLVQRTLKEINRASLYETIVVTGHEESIIASELSDLNPTIIDNPQHRTGIHSSIRAGLTALGPCDAFFICLANQPYFDHQVLTKMIESFNGGLLFPTYLGQRGRPVLISASFIPEILGEPDADHECLYLLKRHPYACVEVPVSNEGILIDIDTSADYQKFSQNFYNALDPVEEFHTFTARLRTEKKPFILATVIEVLGSASARTGSKAVFDQTGKNLLGWVGGGCAERFIGEESVAALNERKTRIVFADLDDEIFGLGVACGGSMRVFLDPILPSDIVTLPDCPLFQNEIRVLTGFYGWSAQSDFSIEGPKTVEDLLVLMAQTIAKKRGQSAGALRIEKKAPATFLPLKMSIKKEVTIVGRTRITEALARHFTLLSYDVRVVGADLKTEDYPETVKCSCLMDSYDTIEFRPQEVVIIASHTTHDPQLVERAITQKASYVGMVGSYKRSVEVLTHLKLLNQEVSIPLYIPAGLDIDAQNPDEIALSIVAEVITESQRSL